MVAYELARVDDLGWQIFEATLEFSKIGIVQFRDDNSEGVRKTYIESIAEVPPIISLMFGEAINHMRSALEHTLFWLVERAAEFSLEEPIAQKVKFPICSKEQSFKDWAKKVKVVPGLESEGPLVARVRSLQPFADSGTRIATHNGLIGSPSYDHPLVLLQAYSNIDKHRRVHTAAAQELGLDLGPDPSGVPVEYLPPGPYEVGQLVSTGPVGVLTYMDMRPAVMLERPTDNAGWVPPGRELNELHRYVAEVAIPTLLTGLAIPGLLPQLDLNTVQHGSTRGLGREYAFDRTMPAIEARLAETAHEVSFASQTAAESS
ncbi:hypothetical protein B2J88_01690 [Rhodococcus sp. SRB_17]|nr:hypothetical protein [Rhodococcus sp. SRB_17]